MDKSTKTNQDKLWRIKTPYPLLRRVLARDLDVSPITAQLLINRGLYTLEQCREFFDPSLDRIHDPFLMKDMDKACARITQAIKDREKIVVYGDYDADGVTATALMLQVLERLGGSVDYYIPHRLREGYGLNVSALERCLAGGAGLVITVDCGINASSEGAFCRERGLDLIITDHHEPAEVLPDAQAIINPKRADCGYPFKELAGVGVALKLAAALLMRIKDDNYGWRDYLDLCCLGSIADVVPLLGENRIIVKHGLEQLSDSQRPGLTALIRSCGLKPPLAAGDISFTLAPRLNSVGRMAQADRALQLLLTSSADEAGEIAEELKAGNIVRQEIGNNIYAEALGIIDGQPDLAASKVLVLSSPKWHPGVLGIVAARLAERFYRPVFLIAVDDDGIGKGSARSIPGFNLFQGVEHCREYLVKYGGHAQAAGITVKQEHLAEFSREINRYAGEILDRQRVRPVIDIDLEARLNQITEELLKEIELLQPFGQDNPPPLLACRGAKVLNSRRVGKESAHLKLQLQTNGKQIDGIGFGFGSFVDGLQRAKSADLAFTPEINEYNGQRRLQLKIKDVGTPAWVEIPEPTPNNTDSVTIGHIRDWPELIDHLLYAREIPNSAGGEAAPTIFDRRGSKDRLERLALLAAAEKQVLVLTNRPAETLGLFHYLNTSCPRLAGRITGLYEPTDSGTNREAARQFAEGNLSVLITTPGQAAALRIKSPVIVSFYLPWGKAAKDAVLALAQSAGRVYLDYNKGDLEEIRAYLNDFPPARDLLAGFYTMLRRTAGAGQKIPLDPEKTRLMLAAGLGRPVRDYSLVAAALILTDLDLIKTDQREPVLIVSLLPTPKEKKDLQTSLTYQNLQRSRIDSINRMELLLNEPII